MRSTLSGFLSVLEAAGELHRVTAEVSAVLEIAEIASHQNTTPCPAVSDYAASFDPQHCELGGKALLFERVADSDFPVCINVFGSYRRMEMGLGCEARGGFEAIAQRIAELTKSQPPNSLRDLLGKVRKFLPLLRTPPRRVRQGVCQEVIRLTERGEVDLRRLPLIKCWPLDGDLTAVGWDLSADEAGTRRTDGRYITMAGMHTIHADDAGIPRPTSHNIGMYRAQLLDVTHLAMHWHIHHDGAAHWRSWKRKGEPMPIAICFGGESVLPYAATAPLPPGMSELLIAGFLNGRGIPLVRARTVPLWVPANSEIVIEGYVNTDCGQIGYEPKRDDSGRLVEPVGPGAVIEGPFGDHTGYYSLPDRYPLMQVTAITHRRRAVFPAIIVGPPPQEDYYMGKATERIFAPLLRMLIPDLEDYHLPMFGCFHNCVFIKIDKAYPLQARRLMHAVWGAGQMAWEKVIIVVDHDVDVHDEAAVLRAMFEHCDFKRDIELVNGPLDILDHAAARLGAGAKLGIDATAKIPGEDVHGVPSDVVPGIVDRDQVRVRLRELVGRASIVGLVMPDFGLGRCVFIAVDKTTSGQGAAAIELIWKSIEPPWADFVIAVHASVDLNDWEQVMFHFCANTDPGRDLHNRDHRIGIDATQKIPGDERHGQPVRPYPPVMEMTEEIRQRVKDRWSDYGFA